LEFAGSTSRAVPISSDQLNRFAKRPDFSVLDCKKFNDVTGMEMRSWEEAITEYITKEVLR
jgi:dTDP-4-dehydrorhamnose reductase